MNNLNGVLRDNEGLTRHPGAFTPTCNGQNRERNDVLRMNGLTGFQRDILYILAELDEPNESEIRTHLEEYYDTTVNRGQLYPNLYILIEIELIGKLIKNNRTLIH